MMPPAARAAIAAHLTDALDVHPTLAADDIARRLTAEGWEINSVRLRDAGQDRRHAHVPARPVAPRARGPRARRLPALRRALRVFDVRRLAHEETDHAV
ncbi:hypothetical protein GCM10010329_17190 [Streptomyces spiroverticillatus]|uniref:HTH Mu-type domain-containing protein n=1 Tax=Streptomyces finlayi TaxID=67296 RepID=A0A919C888_9ACTN|nr:hypothetical protein GCM10010329_17190 [Streptomyces spiroverticillatus]GHC81893.1 hypothetical protein GCM10010334_09670 [Streptomyces finlayi]